MEKPVSLRSGSGRLRRSTWRENAREEKAMIEKYFEWKAIEYFAGWGIIIAIAIMIAIGALIVWIYKKMCDRQKKRLDRMMKKWEEEESRNEEQNK